jgi:NAD(P)-dependent dehydrogenase (short-subunit alcohol dehydrogenase family)
MKVILTGATSSIGLSIARKLSEMNFTIGLLGRDTERLEELQQEISGVVAIRKLDMKNDLRDINRVVSALCEELGEVDAVISTHGKLAMSPLRDATLDQWEASMRVNLYSNVEILRAFRKYTIRSKTIGKVVFISSVATSRGSSGLSPYSASKAAMESLVRSAALEFARDKILVNSIQLGLLDSGMGSKIRDLVGKEAFSKISDFYPLGLGVPADAWGAVRFLLSDESNWVTGTNIVVDGGYLAF